MTTVADRNDRYFDPITAARTGSPFGFDPPPDAPRRSPYYAAEHDPTSASFQNADAPFTRVDPDTGKELVHETSFDPYSTADVLHDPTARAAERARDFEQPLQPI